MIFDISPLLDEWDYEPGQILVRKFKSASGVEKIQLRLDLGILQMNAHGRPDGKRPFGKTSLLDHFEIRLKAFCKRNGDADHGFQLTPDECTRLQQEAVQFHHRYICLFQLHDYRGVIRDTERNIRAFDFMNQFAPSPEALWPLHHLMPQLLLLKARSSGMQAIENDARDTAIQAAERGIQSLRSFYDQHGKEDMAENSGEIRSLEKFLREIRSSKPATEKEKLEQELQEAIRVENFERAAVLRDQLKKFATA